MSRSFGILLVINVIVIIFAQDDDDCVNTPYLTVRHLVNNYFMDGYPFSVKCFAHLRCPGTYPLEWVTPANDTANNTVSMSIRTLQVNDVITSTLTVRSADWISDSGDYGCLIEDGEELRANYMNISVKSVLGIEDVEVSLDTKEMHYVHNVGEDFRWPMTLYAFPPDVSYKFYRRSYEKEKEIDLHDHKYSASFAYEKGDFNFTAKDLRVEDSGHYTVKVESDPAVAPVEANLTAFLVVKGPPKFKVSTFQNVTVIAGGSVTVTGYATAFNYEYKNPLLKRQLKVRWSINKRLRCDNVGHTLENVNTTISGEFDEDILTTVSFEPEDGGYVLCEIQNEHGMACVAFSHVAVVYVSKWPYVGVWLTLVTVCILVIVHLCLTCTRRRTDGFKVVRDHELRTFN